jgi:hypothetical protein
MILSFILVAVLYPTTGVMVEVCDYVGSMITIRSEMEKQTLMYDSFHFNHFLALDKVKIYYSNASLMMEIS